MAVKIRRNISKIILKEDIHLSKLSVIEKMSVRSVNVCQDNDINSLENLIFFFVNHPRGHFLSLRNCGFKVNSELINICQKYEFQIIYSGQDVEYTIKPEIKEESKPECSLSESKDSQIEEFLLELKLKNFDINKVVEGVAEYSEPPLFKILELLIDFGVVFKTKTMTKIFKETFNFYQNQNDYTLEGIGKQVNLTRERVRQIRESLHNKIKYGFYRNQLLTYQKLFQGYLESTKHQYIHISDEFSNKINNNEKTNFTKYFIYLILSKVFSDKLNGIGDLNLLLNKKILKKGFKSENVILVNKMLTYEFDFKKFVEFLEIQVNYEKKRVAIITFEFIFRKFKLKEITEYQSIKDIVLAIVSIEFSTYIKIVPDGLRWINTKRSSLKSCIVDILIESRRPLHYCEIHKKLLHIKPSLTEVNVHTVLTRESSVFGLKGSGIYDLRSKGGLFGSIGDVTEKLLKDCGRGIEWKTLKRLLLRELIISERSIDTVLFSYDKKQRFIKISEVVFLRKWLKNGQIPQSFYLQEQLSLDLF